MSNKAVKKLKASPEFKGIKTVYRINSFAEIGGLKASPEFKGIKTATSIAYPMQAFAKSQP